MAKKAVNKKTEQARPSVAFDPVTTLAPPYPHLEPPPPASTVHSERPLLHQCISSHLKHNMTGPASPSMQDHEVLARHNKFGTFEVPKEFLNTQKTASAAVANKAVGQARRTCVCSLPDTACACVARPRTARLRTLRSYPLAILPLHRVSSCTLAFLTLPLAAPLMVS